MIERFKALAFIPSALKSIIRATVEHEKMLAQLSALGVKDSRERWAEFAKDPAVKAVVHASPLSPVEFFEAWLVIEQYRASMGEDEFRKRGSVKWFFMDAAKVMRDAMTLGRSCFGAEAARSVTWDMEMRR